MEIILRENIAALGAVGEVVKVKAGYARNYLIPNRLAYMATDSNKKRLEAERTALEAKQAEQSVAAEEVAKKIEALSLTIAKEAGEEDKLYGSVTSADVEAVIRKEGITIDRKMITFSDAIRTLGEHTVDVRVYTGVIAKVTIKVVRV